MNNPKCVTHFTGCACQEAKLAQLTQELEEVKRERDEARAHVLKWDEYWQRNDVAKERDRLQAQLATAVAALEGGSEKGGVFWREKALADIHGEK